MITLRPISILLVLACGCDRAVAKYANVDQPDPVPQAKAAPPPKKAEPVPQPSGEALAAECTRGTGVNAAGECVPLTTRALEHVQQVQIPSGEFIVGDAPTDYDFAKTRLEPKLRWAGQPPRVVQSEGFWMDLYEVTRSAYEGCVKSGKCTAPVCDPAARLEKLPPESLPNTPQTCVSHAQAQQYCAAQGGRLPTEIEWEYAARGVDARLYPWGSEVRDEYMAGLLSVKLDVNDASYFGLRGLGSNATEWVADVFDRELPLSGYLEGPFRQPDGPLMQAEQAARPPGKPVVQHVFKSARVGDRYASAGADPMVGFRCAADLGGEVAPLTVPARALPLPLVRPAGSLRLFGGIAEAVSLAEATAFCAAVSVKAEGRTWADWRLPTLEEVNGIAEVFRGPGPFWSAADGPIVQVAEGVTKTPTAVWVSEAAQVEGNRDPLAARCVHDVTEAAPSPPR